MEVVIDGERENAMKIVPTDTSKTKTYERTTHLYLQDKGLKKVPIISGYKSCLQVLYLYNNDIQSIENFNNLGNLTSLYLHNNKIERIENLKYLKNLKKLYLGHNNISILEGLECLNKLEELHVEKQILPNNASLCFDPRSINALSQNLRVLNIAHNNIISLENLKPLIKLEIINASNNALDDLKDVCETVRYWINLKDAKFIGNDITKCHRYRENIIANTTCLELLDNKYITDTTRIFIKRFEEEKLLKKFSKPSLDLSDNVPDLAKNYPPPLQKAITASIIKTQAPKLLENDLSTFDERNAIYLAWKALPKAKLFAKWHKTVKNRNDEKDKKVVIDEFPRVAKI